MFVISKFGLVVFLTPRTRLGWLSLPLSLKGSGYDLELEFFLFYFLKNSLVYKVIKH